MRFFRQFASDDRGATVIEYGLICALIIIGIMVSLNTFAGRAVSMLFSVSNAVVRAG